MEAGLTLLRQLLAQLAAALLQLAADLGQPRALLVHDTRPLPAVFLHLPQLPVHEGQANQLDAGLRQCGDLDPRRRRRALQGGHSLVGQF